MFKAKMHFKYLGVKFVVPLSGDSEDEVADRVCSLSESFNLKYSCTVWE